MIGRTADAIKGIKGIKGIGQKGADRIKILESGRRGRSRRKSLKCKRKGKRGKYRRKCCRKTNQSGSKKRMREGRMVTPGMQHAINAV